MADALHLAESLAAYLAKAIDGPQVPAIPPELDAIKEIHALRQQIVTLRDIQASFSRGDFSPQIQLRGAMAGQLKTLQANLQHLCWQIQQVAGGDFSQRVEFLGDVATAFNSMVEQLSTALSELRRKEEQLTRLTEALQREVQQKADALTALSKSEARFRYMAEHDPLTGVCNRRSFYDLAAMDLEQARTANRTCVLVIFDIDHFKHFNDTYGHLEGDTALRHVTRTVKAQLRDVDILGRYGGEEFVILLPGLQKADGEAIAERLRLAVATSPVETKTHGLVSITVSIGAVVIPPDNAKDGAKDGAKERTVNFLEKMLGHADAALYQAKESGRDRWVVSSYPKA